MLDFNTYLEALYDLHPSDECMLVGIGLELPKQLLGMDFQKIIVAEADLREIEKVSKIYDFSERFFITDALIAKDDVDVKFQIASNPSANTFADIEDFREIYPNIALRQTLEKPSISLDTFMSNNNLKNAKWLILNTLNSKTILERNDLKKFDVLVCKMLKSELSEVQTKLEEDDFKHLRCFEKQNPKILWSIFVRKSILKQSQNIDITSSHQIESKSEIMTTNKQKKILVIGFSVSEQNGGYVDRLKDYYGDSNVDSYSIGGGHMSLILYLLSKIDFLKYTDCILEVSTSVKWHGNDYNRYFSIISHLVGYIGQYNIQVHIFQLYRDDVNYQNDALFNAIENCALINNLNYKKITKFIDEDSKYLRDGIHPTEEGIKLYTKEAIDLLETRKSIYLNNGFEQIQTKYNPRIITIDSDEMEIVKGNYKKSTFKRRDVSFNTFIVEENDSISIKFIKNIYIMGILCKIGKETSKVQVLKNNELVKEFHLYDQRNYYQRYSTSWFRLPDTNEITIHAIRVEPLPKLLKGEQFLEKQSITIVGILCSDIMLPY